MKKRIVSLLMALVMALSLLPTGAFATGGVITPTEPNAVAQTQNSGADDVNNNIDDTVQWKNFRNSDVNMAITDVQTPKSAETTVLKWAKKLGTSWEESPSVPIIVGDSLIVMSGTTLYKLSLADGTIQQQATMAAAADWGYTPLTYAAGLIICPLGGGIVQAFDAKTLTSVWVYKDEKGGQAVTPITYDVTGDTGLIYTGFWNGEEKEANYVCLTVTDDDSSKTNESKTAKWTKTVRGGFYWAGSVVVGDYVIFGSDDGASGSTGTSTLYALNKTTGAAGSSLPLTGIGDQRSSIAYANNRVYFTTKSGYLCSAAFNSSIGELSDLKSKQISTQSTGTPVVYGDYVYVCGGSGVVSGSGGAGNFFVAKADTLEVVSHVELKAYPQCSPLLSTAYSSERYLYFYCTYNGEPGGVSLIKVSATDHTATLEELYNAKGYEQYCIASIVCDTNGNLYYKNDSGSVLALTSNSTYATGITVNGTAVADFDAGVTSYECAVPRGKYSDSAPYDWVATESVTVTAAVPEGASVTINNTSGSSQEITLAEGGTAEAAIVVTNGSDSRTYTVKLRLQSNDASLAALKVNESNNYSSFEEINPDLNEAATLYLCENISKSRSFANLWPEAKDSNATVKVYAVSNVKDKKAGDEISVTGTSSNHNRYAIYFGSETEPAVVRVVVTAEDGTTTAQYRVALKKRGMDTKTEITAYVTLSVAGKVELMQKAVTVPDLNGDGLVDVDEVLYTTHKTYAPNKANDYAKAYNGSWWITKLWGSETTAVSYWLNDVLCGGLTDTVEDGSYLSAFVYKDKTGWSDAYVRYQSPTAALIPGESTTLTLEKAEYENYALVWKKFTGAAFTVYTENGTTTSDVTVTETTNGSYTVSGTKSGTYYLVATAANESEITVPAVCRLTVLAMGESRTTSSTDGTTTKAVVKEVNVPDTGKATVTITAKGSGTNGQTATTTEVTIPTAVTTELKKAEAVKVETNVATLSIDKKALTDLTKASGNLVLTVKKADESTTGAKFELTAKVGNTDVFTGSAGKITVTVPWATAPGFRQQLICYCTDGGKNERMGGTFDGKSFSWDTNHFSTFEIKTETVASGREYIVIDSTAAAATKTSGTSGTTGTSTTTTTAKSNSATTFDPGVGLYTVTAILSVTGMAWVGKKKH